MNHFLSSYRRHCIAISLALLATLGVPALAAPQHQGILILGDSLSAEYGLARGAGWVALLEKKLAQDPAPWPVVNASISGETTAGGVSRLPALLQQHRPRILVIELGANDALRGLSLSATLSNLQALTRAGQAAGARVLLLGQQLPPNYGREHTQRFARLYAQVARERHAALVPFMLRGIADAPDPLALFQADRIHPSAQAQPQILDNVWPELQRLRS